MIFYYTAKDEKGKSVTGTVDSSNVKSAALALKNRGLVILSLSAKGSALDMGGVSRFLNRVSLGDKVNFTHQVATMVSSGLTLTQSLRLIVKQIPSKSLKQIVTESLRDVEAGLPFSASLQKFPNAFSNTYISLIKSGEASGNLDTVLTRLAETLEKQRDFKSRVKAALIYPIIVSIAMVGVFVMVMVFVVPKLTQMYTSLNVELPLPTKVMIAISGFISTKWYLLALLLAGVIFGKKYFEKTPKGKIVMAKLALKAPIFGEITKQKEITEFTRTFSLLMASGVPIVDCLNISSDSVDNVLYSNAIKEAAKRVEKGMSLSEFIEGDKIFPPIVSQMIMVGQETGKMDEVLEKLSHYFEGEVDMKLKNLSTALEPMIIIVLGVMVAFMILSIITPIYKLTSSF